MTDRFKVLIRRALLQPHTGVLHKNAYTQRDTLSNTSLLVCLSFSKDCNTHPLTHMYAGKIIYSVALEASSAVTQADNKASPQWKC